MSAASDIPPRYCPECGAEVRPDAVLCWCCRHSLLQKASTASQRASAVAIDESVPHIHERTKFQFTLASIMLLVTFTAVLMSIYTMAPGLGIALMILSAPALVRTIVVAMRKGSRGQPLSFGEKAGIFLAWIGVGLVVIVSAGIGFFISCLVGLPGGGMVPVVLGIIGAIITAIFVFTAFWRKFKV